jgi:hypothetical protein
MSIDKLKMIFGFALLLSLVALAAMVALGHVEEHTSFGLPFILGSLASLSGGFVNWAFGAKENGQPKS